jgi:opacity protein-like surface antigen
MKNEIVAAFVTVGLSAITYAGPEPFSGKEMKQVAPAPPACPEWYADNEWNVSLWGAYVFSNNNHDRNPRGDVPGGTGDFDDTQLGPGENAGRVDLSSSLSGDHYLETDHAWGGGIDAKYFFRRYFGIGIEGFVLDARRTDMDVFIDDGIFHSVETRSENRAIGSVLGTLTFRYPFHCTRFAPYAFAAAGVIFGGGERDVLVLDGVDIASTHDSGTETRAVGQFGGGLEIRITPHVGWTGDFSWNVLGGPNNNFGMVRTGINFAF